MNKRYKNIFIKKKYKQTCINFQLHKQSKIKMNTIFPSLEKAAMKGLVITSAGDNEHSVIVGESINPCSFSGGQFVSVYQYLKGV